MKMNKMKLHSRVRNIAAISLISLLAIGCSRSQRQHLAIAYVIDMTASVDNEAIMQAFAAIQPLLNNKTLKRGDSITIIPITGDTLTETQGKIIRIHLPENREVYDSDLAKLAADVQERLQKMQSEATANPYQHSDILGAADLAAEELSTEKGNVRKVIVILSDFIHAMPKVELHVHLFGAIQPETLLKLAQANQVELPVTTVAGLIIAIPSLGAFALFRSRVDQLVAEAAYAALHALSPLKQRGGASTTSAPPPPPRVGNA